MCGLFDGIFDAGGKSADDAGQIKFSHAVFTDIDHAIQGRDVAPTARCEGDYQLNGTRWKSASQAAAESKDVCRSHQNDDLDEAWKL